MTKSNFAKFLMTFKKVKYTVLDTLFNKIQKGDKVNFFIDMRFVLNFNKLSYYKEQYEKEFVTDSNTAVAEFLNLIVHYKRYFFKKGCDVSFIVMTEENDADKYVKEIYPEFPAIKNASISKPTFLKFFSKKLEAICRLAPGIFVINSKENDLAVIPIVLSDEPLISDADHSIIMSNDARFWDVMKYLPNPCVFKTNKDNTKVISQNEYFWMISEENKYKLRTEGEYSIQDVYVPLFEALVGFSNLPPIRKDKFKLITQLKNYQDGEEFEKELIGEALFKEQSEEIFRRIFIMTPSAIYEKMVDVELYEIKRQLDETTPSYKELYSISTKYLNDLVEINELFK